MRRRSSRTSGWPRTSSKWTSHTQSEAGCRAPVSATCYRRITITPRRSRSASPGHLRSGELDEPSHLYPRSLRIDRYLASDRLAGLRVVCRAGVFLDLFAPPSAVFVVPEIQITSAPHGLDAIPATDHHRAHRSMSNPRKCYRYLTITRTWANPLPRPTHLLTGASSDPTSSRSP